MSHLNDPFNRKPRRKRQVQPEAPRISLDQPGRLRIKHLLALLAISKSTFYARRAAGTLPPADGNDGMPFYTTVTVTRLFSLAPDTSKPVLREGA